MKSLLHLFFIFIYSSVEAAQYDFQRISIEPGFNVKFQLINTTHNLYNGVLDCQSFFQKLDFLAQGSLIEEHYISINECEFFYEKINECLTLEEKICFDTTNLFKANCDCL